MNIRNNEKLRPFKAIANIANAVCPRLYKIIIWSVFATMCEGQLKQ